MKTKLQLSFAIIIGSFALHCTQSSMHGGGGGGGGDGGVGDARADTGTCCTVTAQTFTKIAEGDVSITSGTTFETPTFDASPYRELVVGYTTIISSSCNVESPGIEFEEPGSSVFIATGQSVGRVRVDGPTAKLVGFAACTGTAHYVIAGVGLN